FDEGDKPRLFGVRASMADRLSEERQERPTERSSTLVADRSADRSPKSSQARPTERSSTLVADRSPGSSQARPAETLSTKVPAAAMSDGTADALYLSLRLASLLVHLDTHAPIPLIVDDCLIQFDDVRTAAALQILSELGQRTQVILFTHHQHLIELAQAQLSPGSYHVHRLDKS